MDLSIHCGPSTFGLYIYSLDTVEISSGWWEAEAIMGKGQIPTFEALKKIQRYEEDHLLNGKELIRIMDL